MIIIIILIQMMQTQQMIMMQPKSSITWAAPLQPPAVQACRATWLTRLEKLSLSFVAITNNNIHINVIIIITNSIISTYCCYYLIIIMTIIIIISSISFLPSVAKDTRAAAKSLPSESAPGAEAMLVIFCHVRHTPRRVPHPTGHGAAPPPRPKVGGQGRGRDRRTPSPAPGIPGRPPPLGTIHTSAARGVSNSILLCKIPGCNFCTTHPLRPPPGGA